jgi:hypothetical protein
VAPVSVQVLFALDLANAEARYYPR